MDLDSNILNYKQFSNEHDKFSDIKFFNPNISQTFSKAESVRIAVYTCENCPISPQYIPSLKLT